MLSIYEGLETAVTMLVGAVSAMRRRRTSVIAQWVPSGAGYLARAMS
jgi:hypothetical protein